MRIIALAGESAAVDVMSQPVRVLHFADLHIGIENYGKTDSESGVSSRVKDFLRRIDEVIDFARENDVDLAIFAGDAFHSRSPNQTYQREFAQRILQLSQLAPTVLLLGNHDLPATASKASTIEIYDTLKLPNIWVAQDYEVRRIATKRGDVVIGAAPYPARARLLADVATRGMTIAEQDAELQRILHEWLEALNEQADALAEADAPRLLCGHFSVNGATWGSERSALCWGGMRWSILMRWRMRAGIMSRLGHVHRHQNLTAGLSDSPPVVYSGSLERFGFEEADDAKGFCWVELARGRGDLALR